MSIRLSISFKSCLKVGNKFCILFIIFYVLLIYLEKYCHISIDDSTLNLNLFTSTNLLYFRLKLQNRLTYSP